MTRQAKVYVIPKEHVVAMLRGEGRLMLPSGAEILSYSPVIGDALGVLVHCSAFPATPLGQPLPRVTATMERRA